MTVSSCGGEGEGVSSCGGEGEGEGEGVTKDGFEGPSLGPSRPSGDGLFTGAGGRTKVGEKREGKGER